MKATQDTRRFCTGGWALVLGGFVATLAWAAFAPLDRGVAVPGRLVVQGQRQSVQHPVGGVIERINVANGDRVIAGQVLLTLERADIDSQLHSLDAQYATAMATQARLEAQVYGRVQPAFAADPRPVGDQIALQQALFESQAAARRAEQQGLEATRLGASQQISALLASQATKRQQASSLVEQLTNLRQLAADGLVSRHRVLELERLSAQLVGARAEEQGRLQQLRSQVIELTERLSQREEQQHNEVRSQLLDIRLQGERLQSDQVAARIERDARELRAPVAGVVTSLAVFTEGGVIGPGQVLLDVIADAQPLLVEAQLPVQWVDQVRPGLPVEVTFSAYGQAATPRQLGEVVRVSADRELDRSTAEPYYLMHIGLADVGGDIHGLELRAGMSVEAFVRTGERTLLSYLLKPLRDRAHAALGEK